MIVIGFIVFLSELYRIVVAFKVISYPVGPLALL